MYGTEEVIKRTHGSSMGAMACGAHGERILPSIAPLPALGSRRLAKRKDGSRERRGQGLTDEEEGRERGEAAPPRIQARVACRYRGPRHEKRESESK